MVFNGRIDSDIRARVFYLRHIEGLSLRKVADLCNVSLSSVLRISEERRARKIRTKTTTTTLRRGRPRKLTNRQGRLILRCMVNLRSEEGNFSAKRIMERAGVSNSNVSVRTVTRFLNENGYFYLQARKKGLLRKDDLTKRLAFVNHCRKTYRDENFWTHQVSFYLDGTAFAHKTNPFDQACAPKGRIWGKKSEGLTTGCTSKGRKEGTGGRVLKLMVAISYGKGVIMCEPYEKMSGSYFADFIDRNFNRMFQLADKGPRRVFVQDGDPCQNSAAAKRAMNRAQAELLKLPARSPDLAPIENLFHFANDLLRDQAKLYHITKETFKEFENRVISTITRIPVENINNLILSMNKRLHDVISSKGNRLKY